MSKKLKAISLFSSAGIGELLLDNSDVEIVVANDIVKKRLDCFQFFYPKTKCICGDICDDIIKDEIVSFVRADTKLAIITPPCQGLSTLGKNKYQQHYENDNRNFLILEALKIVDRCDFDYILIENVLQFIEMYFPYKQSYFKLEDILRDKYDDTYYIDLAVLNAKDYGICQSRPRAIIKMYKKNLTWSWPSKEKEIPLESAIGHLPSLEAGERSNIPWHYAKSENSRSVLALKHTAPGKSAIANEVYYPKKENGDRIKGFHNTYKRMTWNEPAPARTTYSGSISSHNNVHPGRPLEDGTYSDARVLTLLETFIVSSIPENITFPDSTTETFIRTIIGEAIPPRLLMKIIEGIGN
jgi:DNA (cytosine-5)-methyltransferase 1